MSEFFNIVKRRRSIRSYKDKKIEREKIEKMVQAALTAPSGRGKDPVEVIVVEDEKTLEKLANSRGKASQWLKGAPLGMVILADSDSSTWISDASIVATIIQLQAEEFNIGSCWLHVENRKADDGSDVEENIKEILDIPSEMSILCMLSLGYKNENKSEHDINNLKYEKIHYEKYEKSK